MRKTVALLAVLMLGATPAAAQSDQLGLALIAWVQSIDATPDWQARLDGLTLNEGTRSARVATLTIAAEAGGMAIELKGLTLDGYAEPSGGGFTARALKVDRATVKNAETDIAISNVDFEDIAVPALAGLAFQRREPFTSMLPVLAAIARSKSARGSVGEVAIVERFQNVESRIAYRNIAFTGVANGRIESVRAAPLTVESPSPNPLVDMTVATAEARGIDLDAFLAVYDPARYTGAGNRQWRTAVAHTSYSDITLNAPGLGMRIAGAVVENFSLRQPSEPFAPLADASLTDSDVSPELMRAFQARYLADLLGAYGIGKFIFTDVSFTAQGVDELTLDRFLLSEASSDRIGEIAIEGFVGAIPGQGGLAIGRLAFGGLVPPATEKLIAASEQSARGMDVDFSALAPQIESFEASGINLQAVDFPGATLARMRIDSKDYVGSVPTNTAVRVEGLDIPVAELLPGRASGIITSLGYERLDADLAFDLAWNESDATFKLDGFDLDIDDFGRTTADILLTGLTREMLESADPAELLSGLGFDSASLTFEDKSVVDRSLSLRADLLKVPLDRLKQQLAGALPLMLAFVGNPDTVQKIVPALQSFIKTPGTLTIDAKPSSPVPVSTIEAAIKARPQSLPGLLSITLSGTPGGGGEAPAEAPKAVEPESPPIEAPMRKTLAPEIRPDTTGSTRPIPAERP